jgi:hypothetical protein
MLNSKKSGRKGNSLIEVISQNLLAGTEENQEHPESE